VCAFLQVTQLQQQVSVLQQSRDIQERELSRLKAEALTLAARTAAAVGAGPDSPAAAGSRPSSSRASSNGGDTLRVPDLHAQLTRLQRELAAAQLDRQQLQAQLARLAASSSSSGSGVSSAHEGVSIHP
jgi:hypothetical protein